MFLYKYFDISDNQRQQIYSLAMSSVIGFGIVISLVLYMISSFLDNSVIYTILGIHVLVLIYRLYPIYLHKKTPKILNCQWILYFNIGAFLSGLPWSLTFIYLINYISLEVQYLMFAVIVGLAGAGIASLGAVFYTYLFFVVPLFLPLIGWLLFVGDKTHTIAGILLLILFGYYIMSAYRIFMNQEELTRVKKRMDLAFDGNRDAIWDWSFLDKTLYISEKWKEIVGYEDSESYNKLITWKKRIHPEDVKKLMKTITLNKNKKLDFMDVTYRIRKYDGNWIWIQMRGKCHFDTFGRATRMKGTLSDVTNETNFKLKNTQLAQIIKQTNDAIILTDIKGYIENWNLGAEKLLGYSYEEVIHQHISLIYPQNLHQSFEIMIQTLLKKEKYLTDIYMKNKEGKIIPVSLSLSLLKDNNGNALNMIGYINDITERKKAEEALLFQKKVLKHQAHHDMLTGLPNRALFTDRLEHGLEESKRRNQILALLFIDLDHFKEINDSLGHGVGDEVLKKVTARLKNVIRREDTLAQLGGDEFTVIAHNIKNKEDSSYLANKIVDVLREPIVVDQNILYVTSSIGISTYPDDGKTMSDLLKYADAAMYKAKEKGRNSFQFYSSEMTKKALDRIEMEQNLREALTKNQFVVYYQPQVDGATNSLIGMEALVRWQSPDKGLIPPGLFIPLAESTSLIVDIDLFVMRTAMTQLVQWYKEGLNPGKLALNLAIKQLENKKFLSIFESMLGETACKPEWIELEVTEGQIMKNPEESIKVLNQISKLGIELAVDDFGTGYSSLAYLKKLPINKLKIDQSFIRELPSDEEDSAVVKGIIALAQSLNLKLIAEGVEKLEQKKFLVENGCSNIQGYFYSRPIPSKEMRQFLTKKLIVQN